MGRPSASRGHSLLGLALRWGPRLVAAPAAWRVEGSAFGGCGSGFWCLEFRGWGSGMWTVEGPLRVQYLGVALQGCGG